MNNESTTQTATTPTYRIDTWWDRSARVFITRVLDAWGNQVGPADLDGNKPSRDASVRFLQAKIDNGEIAEYENSL